MSENELTYHVPSLAASPQRNPIDAAGTDGGVPSPIQQVPGADHSGDALSSNEREREPAEDGGFQTSLGPSADESPLPEEPFEESLCVPNLTGQRRGRRLVKPAAEVAKAALSPEQRLLILDTWQRSGLPAGDFAVLVGVSKHTLYAWKEKFQAQGPAGLMDQPRGSGKGSRLPDLTRRTILMLKQSHPEWGCQRISDLLFRGPALPASPAAVARVLHEAGYQLEETPTHPHPEQPRRFERARPNQLWQTDLFTFILKRQNRRVYLVAFMDDHSRFLTGYGLYASQSAALVLETVRAAIGAYGPPEEMLTDNGSQYVTWRGKSAFAREMEKRGIRQIVASPRRPQTLGKIERFWGTLWRECLETAVFVDLEDARRRIGHFLDYYNFQRPHQGIEGLVPADRFFGAAPEVLRTLRERVAANALELARNGLPKPPLYVTGRIGDRAFSVHTEGERVILKREGQPREEVDLGSSEAAVPLVQVPDEDVLAGMPMPVCPDGSPQGELTGSEVIEAEAPGGSSLDAGLHNLDEAIDGAAGPQEIPGEGGTP